MFASAAIGNNNHHADIVKSRLFQLKKERDSDLQFQQCVVRELQSQHQERNEILLQLQAIGAALPVLQTCLINLQNDNKRLRNMIRRKKPVSNDNAPFCSHCNTDPGRKPISLSSATTTLSTGPQTQSGRPHRYSQQFIEPAQEGSQINNVSVVMSAPFSTVSSTLLSSVIGSSSSANYADHTKSEINFSQDAHNLSQEPSQETLVRFNASSEDLHSLQFIETSARPPSQ